MGLVRHDFFYPLMEEERDLLLKIVEQFCQQQTGKTLNDYYAQLDMEREALRNSLQVPKGCR